MSVRKAIIVSTVLLLAKLLVGLIAEFRSEEDGIGRCDQVENSEVLSLVGYDR